MHDVVITVGILSLLNIEIGISIIAALLTIIGYSLNDTIYFFYDYKKHMTKRFLIISKKQYNKINKTYYFLF